MYALTRIHIVYLIFKHYHWFINRYLNGKSTLKNIRLYLPNIEILTFIKNRQINVFTNTNLIIPRYIPRSEQ